MTARPRRAWRFPRAAGALAAVCALFAVAAVPGAAAAQEAAQDEIVRIPRIGIVDLQQILRDSVAAQAVRTEIEGRQNAYREEISTRETTLRGQQAELERQRTILSAAAFAEREAAFTRSVETLQREVGERNRALEESLSYGMQQVQVAALRVIAEIADEMSLGLVLDKSQLLLVAKGLEFSDRVVARLNEELPSVSTSPPPSEP